MKTKRILSAVMAVMLAVSMTACGEKGNDKNESDKKKTSADVTTTITTPTASTTTTAPVDQDITTTTTPADEDEFRDIEYTEQWIDKTTAEKYDDTIFNYIRITEIYSDCFFAKTYTLNPYEIKLNGTLSDEWCVGDMVNCTFENAYVDESNSRIEADMLTIEAFEEEPALKPVIYLYPEKKIDVSVNLTLDGELTCTYPAYNNGWTVTASPDGTLTDAKGQTYNYLYWEGETYTQYDLSEGFCVKGEDTAAFLEDALAKLGLNRREANEFIVFWLPLMEQNPYNIISFQTDIYTDAAQLDISPAPDTLIRVFMAWKASDSFVALPEQELSAPNRNGFTVVEWGGSDLN